MNEERILFQLSEVREDFVAQAAPGRRRARPGLRWGAAACLCLALGGLWLYRAEHPYPAGPAAVSDVRSEVALVPHWDELTVWQQYAAAPWDGAEYTVHGSEIPADRLGEALGETETRGWDAYAEDDGLRTAPAAVYAIRDIAPRCAVAVQYGGSGPCYAAVNSLYRPQTLGEFVEDLDLRNTLVVNGAEVPVERPLSGPATALFADIDPARVWALLDAAPEAENFWDDRDALPDLRLGLSVSVPLLGYENISVALLADGSLTTNILDTGKRFQLPAGAADDFVRYVLAECDGVLAAADEGEVMVLE